MENVPIEQLEKYTFDLPDQLIARYPPEKRGDSRLLIMNRKTGTLKDDVFSSLPGYLQPEDLLVFNKTRVSHKRVDLKRKTGGLKSTLFLLEQQDGSWTCLMRGARKLQEGEELELVAGNAQLRFQFINERDPEDSRICRLRPVTPEGAPAWTEPGDSEDFFLKYGHVPIPPYLDRAAEEIDKSRYQTVFAQEPGSVAAPTAGLHFTEEILEQLQQQGVERTELTLNVGYGTFAPLTPEHFEKQKLHTENYSISEENIQALSRKRKGRKISVGTTTLRALEAGRRETQGQYKVGDFSTNLFVYPPDRVEAVDGLLTNFHLPGSSLFLLVSAFSNREHMINAYKHAINEKYRFYSYGDAMLII